MRSAIFFIDLRLLNLSSFCSLPLQFLIPSFSAVPAQKLDCLVLAVAHLRSPRSYETYTTKRIQPRLLCYVRHSHIEFAIVTTRH
jgi:hypothetical protein